jgi:hypothetical protein
LYLINISLGPVAQLGEADQEKGSVNLFPAERLARKGKAGS